jgi:hypothetical protein
MTGSDSGARTAGPQQPDDAVAGTDSADVPQHAELAAFERIGCVLQTPVSGRRSSTRAAASRSPVSAATIERTCS